MTTLFLIFIVSSARRGDAARELASPGRRGRRRAAAPSAVAQIPVAPTSDGPETTFMIIFAEVAAR
ncbi:hypothetical protein AB0D67_32505 [Streptosporangium sp. NPDC048047]|uniref:hypothetical protein n=1 Tax=Streptosporangium sp. NPDC048047 TaxID=3155748 RepID=UPI00343EDBD3